MTDILSIKDLSAKRENLVYMAKSAEVAERYEDMCKIMKVEYIKKEKIYSKPSSSFWTYLSQRNINLDHILVVRFMYTLSYR